MKRIGIIRSFGGFIAIGLVVIASLSIISLSDYKIWNNVIENCDNFELEYDNGQYASFVLYDTIYPDSTYICTVFLNCDEKRASIFYGDKCIVPSINFSKSHEAFNLFYEKACRDNPKERHQEIDPRKEILNGFDHMNRKK